MKRFEYRVTTSRVEEFGEIAYFCTDAGACEQARLPGNQAEALQSLLDQQGAQGWELVQLVFGRNDLVAFWKRERP